MWAIIAVVVAVLAVICSRSNLPGARAGDAVAWHGALRLLRDERLFALAGSSPSRP